MSKAAILPHQMNQCRTDLQRAGLFVLHKETERLCNAELNIAPDVVHEVGGMEITITIPEGTTVKRGMGNNDNGTDRSKATQNLYGYAFWALLFRRLATMNQWRVVRNHIIGAMEELMEMGKRSEKLEDYLKRTMPAETDDDKDKRIAELEADIVKLKERLPIPDRIQDTSRRISRPKDKRMPTVEIKFIQKVG